MTTYRPSQSPYLVPLATTIATIPIAFGINAILRPSHALTFFEYDAPTTTTELKLVNGLITVYGIRDIFMGAAMYSAAYFGSRKVLGCMLVGGSVVAFVDGWVCKTVVGRGEWGHWGFAPLLTGVGGVLLGVFDRV